MGFDLTNERIQDTYEQLLQISGSTIVDGTGSVAPVSLASASYADFAVTASYAENAGEIDTSSLVSNATFNAYTSSNDSALADKLDTTTFTSFSSSVGVEITDINEQIDAIEAGSGSADWLLLTNKPEGIVSGAAQTIQNISGSAITPTSVTTDSVITTGVFGFIGDLLGDVSANNVSTTNLTASQALISGDLTVNGTASFAYLQSVTGSAKIIGDAFIQVNTDTPAQRYAGIQVVDSGSTADTASFIWDSENNDFFYEYENDDTDYGVFLIGPEYATKGSPTYNASNKLVKGTGGHHLVDSSITDTGTSVSMSVPLTASAFSGDGSGLTGVGGVTQEGSGTNSIESTVGTAASANGTNSIAIGNAAQVTDIGSAGQSAIAIGDSAVASDPHVIAIGTRADAPAENGIAIGIDSDAGGFSGVALGELTVASSDDTVAIGTRAEATNGNAIAIGRGAGAGGSKAVAIGFGSTANGGFSVALGDEASAGGTNSFAQAAAASAAGNHSIAFGELASAGQDHSIVMGQGAASTATNGIAIGSGSSVSSANEINIAGIFKYDGTSDISLIGQVSSSLGFVGDGSGLTGVSVTSASYAATSSMASGNFKVEGQVFSPTFAGSVASSTSSIDFNNGNFATLNLTTATFLANPTNLQSGTTYTIILDSGSLISNHGTAWKFAGGTAPTYTDGTDVLTCVSDGTNLYATALTDFQ